jgi:hypothetical protein
VVLKINSQEIKDILQAIDILLEIKCLIRTGVPDFELNEKELKLFNSLLYSLKNLLQPLFEKSIPSDKEKKVKNEIITKLYKLIEKSEYILISSNHSKKILKNLGFNPLKLIVSGGPLIYIDFLKINPNLSETNLEGIIKKTKMIINRLKNIAQEDSKITFIFEKHNKTDQIILEELSELKDIIGQDIFLFELPSWKIFED